MNACPGGGGPGEMPHVLIDARGIGPVGLDRNQREAAAHDELAGNARAHAVELRGPVRRLAEQHHARVADALQQRVEVVVLDARERFRRLAQQRGDQLGAAGARARRRGAGARPLLPPLRADQRHEAHRPEFLARVPCAPRTRRTRTSCCSRGVGPIGITSRPPTASCSSNGRGMSGPPAATTIASYGA